MNFLLFCLFDFNIFIFLFTKFTFNIATKFAFTL